MAIPFASPIDMNQLDKLGLKQPDLRLFYM